MRWRCPTKEGLECMYGSWQTVAGILLMVVAGRAHRWVPEPKWQPWEVMLNDQTNGSLRHQPGALCSFQEMTAAGPEAGAVSWHCKALQLLFGVSCWKLLLSSFGGHVQGGSCHLCVSRWPLYSLISSFRVPCLSWYNLTEPFHLAGTWQRGYP